MDPEKSIDDPPSKSVFIFGRDVSQMPCFRNSFLYGISGGVVTGFGTFMFTSKPILGMHVGMASFTVTTIFYWFNCRYKFSKQKFDYAKLHTAMRNKAIYEGTEVENAVENSGGIYDGTALKEAIEKSAKSA